MELQLKRLRMKRILDDYKENMPILEIAKKYGIDPSYPATLARRKGIDRRRKLTRG